MARKKGRFIDGILLLDKPRGLSSNHALQRVKRLFQARKAGHTGSLDPLAEGLLPVCFGEATKFSGYLLHARKRYRVCALLGEQTTTGDAEGAVIERADSGHVTSESIQRILEHFRGEQTQVPPMYSALKHQGRRLYELAREGVKVGRAARPIHVYELELVRLEGRFMTLEVACSKGTYIRTLVEDIARALGTRAHAAELRRISLGPFDHTHMHTLEALEHKAEHGSEALDGLLLPADAALSGWPAVHLQADAAFYLQRGQTVQTAQADPQECVRLYGEDEKFLGIGEVRPDGRVAPKRLLAGNNAEK